MIDLEDRLHALAGTIDVPPTSPHDDLVRGRRRRHRQQWTRAGGAALAAASVVVALTWGSGPGPRTEPVGPAGGTGGQYDDGARPPLPELAALSADRELHDLLADRLGLEVEAHRLTFAPSYDAQGRVEMLAPEATTLPDATGLLHQVSARVARTWAPTAWRDASCHPGCETYELDGATVEVGRFGRDWGWATRRADGTVVVVLLDSPPEELGIEQQQVDAFLREASLPDTVDVAAAWHDRMLDAGLEHLMVGRDSIITGDPSEATGPTVYAESSLASIAAGEARWEGELLTTAPEGCPDELARCESLVVEGVPLTLKHIEGGAEDGDVWVEHDGARVRSRIHLERYGNDWSIPLERVARLLADPFWQDLPESQSVTSS